MELKGFILGGSSWVWKSILLTVEGFENMSLRKMAPHSVGKGS